MALSIGIIFDTIGRRKPYIVATFLASLAMGLYPFCTTTTVYYILGAMIAPLSSVRTIPLIPDFIQEES